MVAHDLQASLAQPVLLLLGRTHAAGHGEVALRCLVGPDVVPIAALAGLLDKLILGIQFHVNIQLVVHVDGFVAQLLAPGFWRVDGALMVVVEVAAVVVDVLARRHGV